MLYTDNGKTTEHFDLYRGTTHDDPLFAYLRLDDNMHIDSISKYFPSQGFRFSLYQSAAFWTGNLQQTTPLLKVE